MTFKKSALLAILVSSFVLTACGGEEGKVYPEGSGPNRQEDDNRRRKAGGAKNKYITSHLAGTVSVALLSLNRAVDIALNKENATSLVKERDCQKLAATGGSVVVTTSVANCRRVMGANDWGGSEQLDITPGTNGLFTALKTKSATYRITVAGRQDHELVVDIDVKKSSNSRPGNTVTYDFEQTLVIRSRGEAATAMENERRNDATNDGDKDEGRREAAARNFEALITVIVAGKLEVGTATKAITGIAITTATVDGQRIIERGRSAPMELSTFLTLRPLSSEILPMTDGRMTAQFSGNQTIESLSTTGRANPKVEYAAEVRIEPRNIKVAETRPMVLATLKPGFTTMLADLETVIQQFFRTLAN